MKRLVSILSALCLAVAFVLSCAVPAMAESEYLPVQDFAYYDQGGLLSDSEEKSLVEKSYSLGEAHSCDIVVITDDTDIADSEGNTDPDDVLDYYLNELGYGIGGPNGSTSVVALYLNITTRDWYISGYGTAEKAVNSDAISYIGEQIKPDLTAGNYYTAFDRFMDLSAEMFEMYEDGKPYKAPFNLGGALIISVILGFVVALIYVSVLKGQLKSVAANDSAADYVIPGSMNLEQSNEFFLYKTVSRVRRQSESSGSHTGSHTGRSHSGGGGKF